jgi:ABC-2 type transport system ATP-binding protein
LHDPKVFVIDEPMVGLDPMHARIVKQELRARAEAGMTLFLSTHQLSVAEEVADRIGIIHHGKLIALGTVQELRSQAKETGALEKVFLSLIDQEEAHREKTAKLQD